MTRQAGTPEFSGEAGSSLHSDGSKSAAILRTLEAARAEIGAECLALAAQDGNLSHVLTWKAELDGCADAAKCVEAATRVCGDAEASDSGVLSITFGSNRRAALASAAGSTELLEKISPQINLALENYRLTCELEAAKEQSRKRVEEVAAVYEIGAAITEVDTSNLLPMITEKAAHVMDAQACSLLIRDFESDELTIEASYGLVDDIVRGTRIPVGQGIAGRVASTGEAMLILDVDSDPRLHGFVRARKDIAASICAPMKDEMGRVMGVLNIRRHFPAEPFTEEDVKLFSIFATQATLAISNANLYTSLTRRVAEISTISDLLRAINSTLDLDGVLNQVADSIVDVVGFDRCCVYLSDPRTGELIAGVCRGYTEAELVAPVAPGDGIVGLAAREHIPIFARDGGITDYDHPGVVREDAHLAAPIVVREECIGVVMVDNSVSNRAIQPSAVELLSTFVSQAGIAIENARLYEAMEEKYSELNVLFEHSKTISSAYGLDNAATIATDVARKAVACDGCGLLLLDERRTSIDLKSATGVDGDVLGLVREVLTSDHALELVRELRSTVQFTHETATGLTPTARILIDQIAGPDGAVLLVPLLAEDAPVGALVMFRREKPAFAIGETQLLSIVASQAAVVLKNAIRYEQRMRRQVLDLSTLYEFSRRISSSSSLEEALDAILSIVIDLVDADEAAIYAIDHEHGLMVPTAVKCTVGNPRKLAPQPLSGNNVMSWTVREAKAVVSPDVSQDQRFDPINLSDRPIRSLMSIPLMVQDDAVGVLSVHSANPNLYSEDDVRVLSIIASQSAAIYKELEALATLTSYTYNILSSIAAGVITLDSGGKVLTWNNAAEKIVGVVGYKVIGKLFRDVVKSLKMTDEDKKSTLDIIGHVQSTGLLYQGYKLVYHPPGPDVMYLNLSASVLSNNSEEPLGTVIIFEDITRDIKMENEFRRMGELAAVGQLAASIAHELRNPLSSIKGAAQYLQKEFEHEASIVEFLGIIIDEVNGLSRLTTEFLEYARPMEFDIGPVDVNEIVEKTLALMCVHIVDSGAVAHEKLAAELPLIQADGKQLEHVLRNMIINSLQAMPTGGEITIITRSIGGHSVELAVKDTGCGIAEEKLRSIFVPFFTTKTKGTGLGLSVVQKIVENHSGRIHVESRVGQGTMFRMILPVAGALRPNPPEADTIDRRQ